MTTRTKADGVASARSATDGTAGTAQAEVTREEVADLYPGEWILFQITEEDAHHRESRGRVVAHGRTRGSIARAERRVSRAVSASGESPEHPYWVFRAYRRISIRTYHHQRNGWILLPLEVEEASRYETVLDTGSPLTSISARMRDSLADSGLLGSASGNWYLLRGLSIDVQPIPDLRVRLSRRVTDVGADGVLGPDFLCQSTDIHFHVPTLILTLRR